VNPRSYIYLSALMIVLSVFLIGLSFYILNIFILIASIIILLVSIISVVAASTIDMFKRDKELDIEKLKENGLHIVTCKNCDRLNVLEDQYCIFCGEKLEENGEQTDKK